MNDDFSSRLTAAYEEYRAAFGNGDSSPSTVCGVSSQDSVRIDICADQTIEVHIIPEVLGRGADSLLVEQLVGEAVTDLIKQQVERYEVVARLLGPSSSGSLESFASRSAALKAQVEEFEQSLTRIQARLRDIPK